MASNSAMNNMELPVSDPPKGGGDERLFRGSGMTKRGAYAAISYMACAGTYLFKTLYGIQEYVNFLMLI